MEILDGKKLRDEILAELKEKIERENIDATLAIIWVGDNSASQAYIKNKIKACDAIGIKCNLYHLDENTSEEDLIKLINELNEDENITGIILQSPVPEHIDFDKCSNLIKASKDVDGFTTENIYNLYIGKETLIPCTVKGIIALLDKYNIPLRGANVVIVGRGKIVGLPLSLALLNRDATVTIAHSKTKDLASITSKADILIAATGRSKLITADMVKEGAVVVDVGISYVDGKITGDVDFEQVKDKCRYISPTPGGVGPTTVAMIMKNILIAKEGSKKK